MSSFGYGGDPNTATRLQMSKDKWYDFNMSYRHDLNVLGLQPAGESAESDQPLS